MLISWERLDLLRYLPFSAMMEYAIMTCWAVKEMRDSSWQKHQEDWQSHRCCCPPATPWKIQLLQTQKQSVNSYCISNGRKVPVCLPGQGPAKSQWVSKVQASSVGAWWPTPPHSQWLGCLSAVRLLVVQDNLERSSQVGMTERLHLETLYVTFRTFFFFLMYCIEKKETCSKIISSFYECLSHARYYGLEHHLT